MKNIKTVRIALAMLSIILMCGIANAQTLRDTEPFTQIKSASTFNVLLVRGENYSVEIKTPEADAGKVKTKIDNGVLKISGVSKIQGENVKIIVTFKELDGIIASGVSSFSSKQTIEADAFFIKASGATKINLDLEVDKLFSEISGAAKVKLSGSADIHTIKVSGAANIKAYDLETDCTNAKVSGASMAYVNATDELIGEVSGVAQLKHTGEPDVLDINNDETVNRIIETRINNEGVEDSVRIKIGNMDVEIIDSETPTIRIGDNEIKIGENGNITFDRHKKQPRFDGHWAGFDIGVNGYFTADNKIGVPDEADFMSLNYQKSINVHINFFEQNFNLINNHLGLVTGLGLEYNNYRFDDNVRIDPSAENFVGVFDENPDKDFIKSKLVVNYLNIPLLLEYQTNSRSNKKSFHISAGVVGGLRIGSHTKIVYEDGGKHKSKDRDDFHLHPFKASAMVRIGWGKINIYGSYSLLEMFENNKGPELYPFSVGITLTDF